MKDIFTIPEGYELKQINENQFAIVEKDAQETVSDANAPGDINSIQEEQMNDAVKRHRNSFFPQVEKRDDYDFDEKIPIEQDRDALWETRMANPYDANGNFLYDVVKKKNHQYHDLYESGKIKKLNNQEMNLLRFTNGLDVKSFLKEEFKNNPIVIKKDDNGYIYGEAPNGVENLGKTNPDAFKWKWQDKKENEENKE